MYPSSTKLGMVVSAFKNSVRRSPIGVTVLLTLIGYALIGGTILGLAPATVYPSLSTTQVHRLSDAIALINTLATGLLILGWYWIRRDRVRRHRWAMLSAFGLILLFLLLYLVKVGGGGTQSFSGPAIVYGPYLVILAIHVGLSILSVPLVLFQVLTGLSYPPAELSQMAHPRIGRIAASAWIVSLTLGVVVYLLLNQLF